MLPLIKTHSRAGSGLTPDNTWNSSAVWRVEELPGMIVVKLRGQSGWQLKDWIGAGIAERSYARRLLHDHPALGQDFLTRREALQALEVAMMLSEA
jgi:hypothetical protein